MFVNDYNQMETMLNVEKQNAEKVSKFKERIEAFKDITTLEEAKRVAKDIIPTSNEMTRFRVGDAECVVINKSDMFRICLNTKTEFISYDFN